MNGTAARCARPIPSPTMHCSFCGAPSASVGRLLAADAVHAVCDGCVTRLSEVEAALGDEPRHPSPGACSFCHGEGLPLILPAEAHTDPPSAMCPECLAQCREVLGL
jgi:hypothetical protein